MAINPLYFQYWGKARPGDDNSAGYHLLPYHCLDVAAVGVSYLRQSKVLLETFCTALNCSEAAFLSWAAYWFALHDLGKFSEAFQSQRPDLIQALKNRAPNPTKFYSERHDSLGYWLWESDFGVELLPRIGISANRSVRPGLSCWLQAVTGHHGMPPKPLGNQGVDFFYCKPDKQSASDFAVDLAALLLTEEAEKIPDVIDHRSFSRSSEVLSWWFAGVTVLADWLGSNTGFFPYRDQPEDLGGYWEYAQRQAGFALAESGVLPSVIAPDQSFSDFFPQISEASPLQEWAMNVDIGAKSQIFLLEDVTGAGKTEAALMLTYRLMAQGLASGFFIGLPTMATANAMYARIAKVYAKLFGEKASLVLAHGFKRLVEEFALSVLPNGSVENDSRQKDETASARCAAWLADHNKRSLLAAAGVGTIDQALLAVLHSKHQSIRLLGLFNKVLIVDEVHACDAYMQGVLETLLEFHARTGGSVILLSATLPNHMKQALLDAYAKGRNLQEAPAVRSQAYPLAIQWNVDESVLKEACFASRASVSRTVKVHYESDIAQVFEHIITALQQGRCVGWIRNTVADALSAYQQLLESVPADKMTLFHARFATQDRLDKEEIVLASFGKESSSEQRAGRLVIATQVAEQSLDVDFDVLITDLAPIDRVLQRAGRLQRHVRDAKGNRLLGSDAKDGRSPPCLWVFAPCWTIEPAATWFSRPFPKAAGVYPHHGQLWLTAKALQSPAFTMPDDARDLMEFVFSPQAEYPEGLQRSSLTAAGQEMSEASLAQQNTLKIQGGYARGDSGDWWSEAKTPSRLGEETMTVMLAKWDGNRLAPWASGDWAYNMVKVAVRWISRVDMPDDPAQAAEYERLQRTLPSEGKWSVLLPLTLVGDGVWQGAAWTAGDEKRGRKPELLTWLYDKKFGLRVAEAQPKEKMA